MEILPPKTGEDFEKYYDLRWRVLREPWGQARGSEKDELEEISFHLMAVEEGKLLGVGRLHFNSADAAQLRFMAVEDEYRGKGVGTAILAELEKIAAEKGAKTIVLNAREPAARFYEKHGYLVLEAAPPLFGVIPHLRMQKTLP